MHPPTRTARLDAVLRRINDEIAARATASSTAGFVCECREWACAEAIELPVDVYRQVRAKPNRFAVHAGHVAGAPERLVSTASTYAIVERTGGS